MSNIEYRIGDTSVTKVHELDLNDFTVTQLLPNLTLQFLAKHPEWIDSRTYDESTEKVSLSVHTWVVKHNGKTILIDTGAGNTKDRPRLKVLDHLHEPFLSRLAGAGVHVEEVDYISFLLISMLIMSDGTPHDMKVLGVQRFRTQRSSAQILSGTMQRLWPKATMQKSLPCESERAWASPSDPIGRSVGRQR